ncbi:MAG: Crp/Fnr family transcriptional regulator, partial [uncultured bacterium]
GASEEVSFRPNEIILHEGESTETLRLIISGNVKIVKDHGTPKQKTLAVLGKGEYFGEMNLFDEEPHSATAIAVEECGLLLIRKERLREIIDLYPELSLEIIKIFSQRLRVANEKLAKN